MSPARPLIAIVLSAMLMALAGVALKWGIGHALLEPWHNKASSAGRAGSLVERDYVQAGIREIEQALKLQNRADAHELLGHYQLSAAQWDNGSQKDLILSKSAFESAISLRPSFTYSWAFLAGTKYRLGEVDAQFYQALGNAIRLGPWDPKVQSIVADYGLAVIDEAPGNLRGQILAQIQRGAEQQGELMLQLALKRGKLETVCALELPLKAQAACAKIREEMQS